MVSAVVGWTKSIKLVTFHKYIMLIYKYFYHEPLSSFFEHIFIFNASFIDAEEKVIVCLGCICLHTIKVVRLTVLERYRFLAKNKVNFEILINRNSRRVT